MTSSCGGEEMANFLGRISPEFRGYTYSFVNKYHPWSWCWWCWCWMNLMTLIKITIKGRWAWNVSYHFYNRTNRDISLECLTQFGGEELQEVLKDAGITNAVHRYWLEYGKRCFWREKGVQGYQLSISIIGIRFSQSLVILQNFSDTGFLRHLMVSKMICFPTAGFRWVCKAQQSETSQPREIPHRVTWAALKLNMMFIWLTHMDRWQCLLTSITGGILQFL